MKKNYLVTPGPTPVPEDVLLAMARPIIHHRTPQFKKIFKEVSDGLKDIFMTKDDVLTFASSGTGVMEGSVSNLLSPKDKVIAVRGGKFGERWSEICEAWDCEVIPIDIKWGDPVEPDSIAGELQKNPDVKAVFTTLCETSTGVVNDIEAIGKVVASHKAILVVDAISGLGADELNTDEWKVDCVVAGSQKGLMIPPGLGFCSVSKKAWTLVEKASLPRYYFDFRKFKKTLDKSDTPWTPAISLVIGLRESLDLISKMGFKQLLKRSADHAEATREACKAMGLKLFSQRPSNAVTAVCVPNGVDGAKLVSNLRDKEGISIAGGQSELKGKIFRIAHMGYIQESDLRVALSAIEVGLAELGYKIKPDSGVAAFEEKLKTL